ncbi:MAG: ABC transporter permease [Bacilli bacterium]|nr:ABC transporter permease [Bacilli bacterium]
MTSVISFFQLAIKFSTVFLFGATGEIINQKSGHLNMGTPGIMYLGALGGIIGERIYILSVPADQPLNSFLIVLIPIIFAMIFSAIGGLIFSFFTCTLHCNQNVTGLTLTTFSVGLACLFIGTMPMDRMAEAGLQLQNAFPWYAKLGWFGEIFLSQSWFTYLGVVVAIVAAIVLTKTKVGLNLRAVGENAAAADSAGINVNAYRYVATVIGGAISGIGGVFFELDKVKGMFNVADAIDAFGWLALCIVIFSMWKPLLAIGASFLFACLSVLPTFLSPYLAGVGYLTYVLQLLPYIATLIVLIINSIVNKKKGQAPANLGINYFREDR